MPNSEIFNPPENYKEIIPTNEVFAAALEEDVDIRPRVWCNKSKKWLLCDTGSQVSVVPPSDGDVLQPHLRLETVAGTQMACYGKKMLTVRLNRKEYHIEAVISKTTDTILGMDFLDKYKIIWETATPKNLQSETW